MIDNNSVQENENKVLKSHRLLTITHVKAHALKCSKQLRGGKFDRVSAEFIDQVIADVETIVRELGNKASIPEGFDTVKPDDTFVTGELMDKIRVEVEPLIGRMIQKRVQRHPSRGKTLMA